MNKYVLFFFTILMFACNSEIFDTDNELELKTKSSSTVHSPLVQLNDIPCNLLLQGSGEFNFLSAREHNWELRLHNIDDGSLRQRWYLRAINPNNPDLGYNIILQGGSDRSNNRPISIADEYFLFLQENNSHIPVTFYIDNIPNTNYYYISRTSSYVKKYLCSTYYNSRYLELAQKNNTGERDKWEVKPVEEYKFVSISYKVELNDGVDILPSYTDAVTVNNQTDTQQSMNANFSRKASESSSFSRTEGLSLQNSVTMHVGIPLFNAQGSITSTTSKSWQFGESETKEDSRSYNFSLTVPAHRKYEARMSIALYNASATYYATYRGVSSGKQITLRGKWYGIQAGKIDYDIVDENGSLLKSFSGVPLSLIAIN